MAKYFGEIGFAETVETAPSVYEETITERQYYGDLTRITRQLQGSEHLNDNLNISNELSIVSDPYAMEHFFNIRYVVYAGTKWKVSNVEVQFPRLILSLGGVYNG